MEKWGVEIEADSARHPLPALVALGFRMGQQWAGQQKTGELIKRFEAFFRDWKRDHLSANRYSMLYEELSPPSIIRQLSGMLDQALSDVHVAEAMLEHYPLFEKGIVWGVMSVVEKAIAEGQSD